MRSCREHCAWTYHLTWSHSLAAWNGSPRSGAPALSWPRPNDAPWRQTLASQTSLEHWLRGRLAEVIALGHEAEVKLPEPTEGGIRLFDPLCLAAAAHTARRAYDAARACLDLALANLPVGSTGKDAWLGLAIRRARLYWLLDALPRLEALVREMEVGTSRLDSSLSPVLLATLRGILALEQENLPVAEQHLTEAVRASVQTPAAMLLARPDLHLARVHESAGRREQAELLIDAALAEVRQRGAPGLIVLEGSAMIPLLRSAAQRGREGPTAARVLGILGVRNVTRRVLIPENGLLLSPREADVLELLAADASNRLIAERLNVDILTVKSHITRVLAKLGVTSRHEAAERAKALGLGPETPSEPPSGRDFRPLVPRRTRFIPPRPHFPTPQPLDNASAEVVCCAPSLCDLCAIQVQRQAGGQHESTASPLRRGVRPGGG